jgi:protein-L-isoaspartate O-methyltransferase
VRDRVALPRNKGRRPVQALVARTVAVVARVVPARALARLLLTTEWLARRHAWEQSLRLLGTDTGLSVLRPHVPAFVLDAIDDGSRVIDIGSGEGTVSRAVATRAGSVLAVDHDPAAVAATAAACQDHGNVETVLGDGLTLVADRGPFDVAILLHALEHLDEPVDALRQIRGHARRVIVEVPDFGADPLNAVRLLVDAPLYSDDDHVSEFTDVTLAEALTSAGWRVTSLERRNGMLLAVADAGPADGT